MNTAHELAQCLHMLPCLTGMSDDKIASISDIARLKRIDKNCVVYEENDPADLFYVVISGSLKLFKASHEGRELLVKKIGPGECVCCAPLFGNKRYSVSAATLEDSLLMAFPAEKIRELLCRRLQETGPGIIACFSERIGYLSMLLREFTFSDVEERILMTLLRLSKERSPDTIRASLTLTHSDIAAMTGTVREVVSRTMSKLKREGIIIESTVKGFAIDTGRLVKLLKKP